MEDPGLIVQLDSAHDRHQHITDHQREILPDFHEGPQPAFPLKGLEGLETVLLQGFTHRFLQPFIILNNEDFPSLGIHWDPWSVFSQRSDLPVRHRQIDLEARSHPWIALKINLTAMPPNDPIHLGQPQSGTPF